MNMWKGEKVKTILAVAVAAVVIGWGIAGMIGGEAVRTVSAQSTDPFLSRRIDQIEQRLYQIDSKIDRVQQESQRPAASRPSILGGSDAEIRALRAELDSMRTRLGEVECGLLRVDERTLTAVAKAARRRATTGGTENCRQNTGAAIDLSARP